MHVDAAYDKTAQDAVKFTPRDFCFVLTCEDYKREGHRLKIVLWPYNYPQRMVDDALAKLGTSPLGKATFTILGSKLSRADEDIEGKNYGKIDWLRFRLDISPRTYRK